MMNVEQCQAAVNPQTKPTDMGCESAYRLLSSPHTVAIYYHSAGKRILVLVSSL